MASSDTDTTTPAVERGHVKYEGSLASQLQRLATAALATGFAAAVAASRVLPPRGGTPLNDNRRLLMDLQELAHVARSEARVAANDIQSRQRLIDSTLEDIDRLVATATFQSTRLPAGVLCARPAEPAVAYLSTGFTWILPDGGGPLTIEIAGNKGVQQFTFASNTLQSDIITAINVFTKSIGVTAARDVPDPHRLVLASTESDADGFVRVRQLAGDHVIFAEPVGGEPLGDLKDYGSNAIVLRATFER